MTREEVSQKLDDIMREYRSAKEQRQALDVSRPPLSAQDGKGGFSVPPEYGRWLELVRKEEELMRQMGEILTSTHE